MTGVQTCALPIFQGIPKAELPKGRKLLLQQGYLLFPIFVLLYYLVVERISVNNSAFFSIVVLLAMALFAHRFKESLGRSLLYAAGLIAIVYGFQFIVGTLNNGLYQLNGLFGTDVFGTETVRWKPEMTMLVILGLVVALTFAVVQRKSNLGATR